MKEIKLTNEDYQKARQFAIDAHSNHYGRGRNVDEIIDNIIQGKLGEIAFYKLNKERLTEEPDFVVSVTPDPGWDFIDIDGTKIDVKTIKQGSKYMTFNSTVKADSYILIEIGDDKVFRLKAQYNKEFLKRTMRKSKFNSSMYIFI